MIEICRDHSTNVKRWRDGTDGAALVRGRHDRSQEAVPPRQRSPASQGPPRCTRSPRHGACHTRSLRYERRWPHSPSSRWPSPKFHGGRDILGTRGCVEKVTPAKIAAAERQQKALEMKRTGATYQSIANALGYRNRSSAADAVTRAFRDTVSKETANEIRLIELARLDSMWIVLWPLALSGDLKAAIDRCLRIMKRRASDLWHGCTPENGSSHDYRGRFPEGDRGGRTSDRCFRGSARRR